MNITATKEVRNAPVGKFVVTSYGGLYPSLFEKEEWQAAVKRAIGHAATVNRHACIYQRMSPTKARLWLVEPGNHTPIYQGGIDL